MRHDSVTLHGAKRFVGFALCGGINTAATLLLYFGLSRLLNYQLAYLIAYLCGIVLAYVMNLHIVFKGQSSVGKIVHYPLIYLVQYLLGAMLLYILVDILALSSTWAPLLAILLLMPVSYCLNKKFMLSRI